MVLGLTDAEPLKPGLKVISGCFLMHQKGSADGSHDLMVGWDSDFGAESLLKGLHYSLVEGYSTLEDYGRLDVLPQGHIIEVVPH